MSFLQLDVGRGLMEAIEKMLRIMTTIAALGPFVTDRVIPVFQRESILTRWR
jgi:hypothetical protein